MKSAVVLVLGVATAAQVLIAQAGGNARPTAPEGRDAALASLVQAERSFARLTGKIGQLPGFLAYFADDVLTFQPLPVNGKDGLRERALGATFPSPRHVDWEPWFADIAESGDIGFTTGPSLFTEVATGKVLATGWYFSIWKHDANGWRVAVDTGIEAPAAGPLRPRELTAGVSGRRWAKPGAGTNELLALERHNSEQVGTTGLTTIYNRYLNPSTRLYRDGLPPVVGQEAIRTFLTGKASPKGWRAVGAVVAASGDLAYTYGLYDVPVGPTTVTPMGAFLHVWKPGPAGWTLAADVVNRGQ